MCVQRVWDEPIGAMPLETFRELVAGLSAFPSPPIIHLGGYGEPSVHPDFLEIVRLAKEAGAVVEMTTNGTMLTRERAQALYDLELDKIVVSVDGVTPQSYSDIRVNSDYDQVIANVRYLHGLRLRGRGRHGKPLIELAFVAMKSNIDDLPHLPELASYLGAWNVKVSNVVPHTPEMETEILYEQALNAATFRASRWVVDMKLPKMDLNRYTAGALQEVYDSRASLSLMNHSLSARDNYCRFAQEGYAAIRWDGMVSPCLSLLHDHPEYIHGRQRYVSHLEMGNINDAPFYDIWTSGQFSDFRQKLRDFPFSPCTTCGGCERFPENQIDCTGNTFPACGGCLWAQGIIECP